MGQDDLRKVRKRSERELLCVSKRENQGKELRSGGRTYRGKTLLRLLQGNYWYSSVATECFLDREGNWGWLAFVYARWYLLLQPPKGSTLQERRETSTNWSKQKKFKKEKPKA